MRPTLGRGGADHRLDRRGLGGDAFGLALDHHLGCIDVAQLHRRLIIALPPGRPGFRVSVGPADVIPIFDMESERDEVGTLGELAKIFIGRRAGAAALRGEKLDNDRRIVGPREGRRRRDKCGEQGEKWPVGACAHPALRRTVSQSTILHKRVRLDPVATLAAGLPNLNFGEETNDFGSPHLCGADRRRHRPLA